LDLPNRMTVQQQPTRLEYQQVVRVARSGTAALVGARSVEVSLQVVRSEEEALLLGRGGLLQGRRGAGEIRRNRGRIAAQAAAAGQPRRAGTRGCVLFLSKATIGEMRDIREDVKWHFLSTNDSLPGLVSETKKLHKKRSSGSHGKLVSDRFSQLHRRRWWLIS
jgi:hypothetical protein